VPQVPRIWGPGRDDRTAVPTQVCHKILATNRDLARRLDDLESKYDEQFRAVFDAIRELMRPPGKPRRPIGFTPAGD
jgi:hypothetical protein